MGAGALGGRSPMMSDDVARLRYGRRSAPLRRLIRRKIGRPNTNRSATNSPFATRLATLAAAALPITCRRLSTTHSLAGRFVTPVSSTFVRLNANFALHSLFTRLCAFLLTLRSLRRGGRSRQSRFPLKGALKSAFHELLCRLTPCPATSPHSTFVGPAGPFNRTSFGRPLRARQRRSFTE